MLIDQISVFIENKPGRLSAITGVLGRAGVDIRALSIADTTDFGILRMIVDKPGKAEKALREEGLTVSTTKVIAVSVQDTPGGLHALLETLGEVGVGVEYAYAFITRRHDDAYVILRVEDNDKAVAQILKTGGRLLQASEVYSI